MKAYMGSRGTAPQILNLGRGWGQVVNFIPGKELGTRVPTGHEAWWAPGSPGCFKEKKNLCFLLGFEPGSTGEQPRHYTDSTIANPFHIQLLT